MNDEDQIELEDKEEQEYQKRLQSLPEDLRGAFNTESVTDTIVEIGKGQGLTIDKIGELGDEIGLVMLGITKTADFIKNLSERLEVDREKARLIAEDVNQKVFQPVRASLRKVHGLPAEKEEVKKIPPLTPPYEGGAPAGGEVKSPVFAKKIVPIDELLDKIDAGQSIIKPQVEIKKSAPPNLPVETKKSPANETANSLPKPQVSQDLAQRDRREQSNSQAGEYASLAKFGGEAKESASLSHDEVRSAVEKALGGKITTDKRGGEDPYREAL